MRPRSTVHDPQQPTRLLPVSLPWTVDCRLWTAFALCLAGCATPQYAIRPTPMPDESPSSVQIERAISEYQGREFDGQGSRPISSTEKLGGIAIQSLVERISRVTERPALPYRAYLYRDREPNAASLADGRIYISSGMIDYLTSRGSRADELAFVLGHELAHTVAQHLVKRYEALQRQQLLMGLVAAGVAAATRGRGSGGEQAQQVALDISSIVQDVRNSGFSQEQELEADQLGIRYVIKAGFDPKAALDLLEDFSRFDVGSSPFMRSHPYSALRREYLQRYLEDTGQLGLASPTVPPTVASRMLPPLPDAQSGTAERIRQLREIQKLYPRDSVSWKNLQHDIDALQR